MADLRMLKWPLFDMKEAAFDDTIRVKMSPNLGVHHVGMQDGFLTLWAMDNPEVARVERVFYVAGTGEILPRDACFLGTVFDRSFVWHLFEIFPKGVL